MLPAQAEKEMEKKGNKENKTDSLTLSLSLSPSVSLSPIRPHPLYSSGSLRNTAMCAYRGRRACRRTGGGAARQSQCSRRCAAALPQSPPPATWQPNGACVFRCVCICVHLCVCVCLRLYVCPCAPACVCLRVYVCLPQMVPASAATCPHARHPRLQFPTKGLYQSVPMSTISAEQNKKN